ncbi:hypothetical protein JAAARDRAFT_50463 [Jaapia argillacea MUCL 33604]|uniref:Uncharacterized protein n=1 Tax=Jaapia argillacea MUCL 33604 TaxID=933084 RepID=A0A067PDV4_9AGAM|nr:hypothetical protein JAAARDRAFT_50463 [Jaapia argillacea MUCL 33604]
MEPEFVGDNIIPSSLDILCFLMECASTSMDMGIEQIRGVIKEAHPNWCVSVKRLHSIRSESPFIFNQCISNTPVLECPHRMQHQYVIVSSAGITSPWSPRDRLYGCLSSWEYTSNKDGDMRIEVISELLGIDRAVEVARFYDRCPTYRSCYYHAYGAICSDGDGDTQLNEVMNSVRSRRVDDIVGGVLVVTNRPMDTGQEVLPNVDAEELGKTLWWYHQAGLDHSEVFGCRELERFMINLDIEMWFEASSQCVE